MLDYMRIQRKEDEELIQGGERGSVDFQQEPVQLQDLSEWLEVKESLPPPPTAVPTIINVTDRTPYKKMKTDFEKRIVSQRSSSKGFLQNRQMGRASKKGY